ncbi:hypothetical protein O6H91_01G128800 [Diphasiastrum complanatum]|uniref:Uncharacterized protein n=1 Tax=Diphasiastrum complanatum TaxID=34168 RepID=A0ACC2EW03_DIPCM|nr:hypothetical protein O6H91_01G128800 [Diphasiastrum complanatum]
MHFSAGNLLQDAHNLENELLEDRAREAMNRSSSKSERPTSSVFRKVFLQPHDNTLKQLTVYDATDPHLLQYRAHYSMAIHISGLLERYAFFMQKNPCLNHRLPSALDH